MTTRKRTRAVQDKLAKLIGIDLDSEVGILIDQLLDESDALQQVLKAAKRAKRSGDWNMVELALNLNAAEYGEKPL